MRARTYEVTERISKEGTEEGTSLIARDNVGFEQADTSLGEFFESEFIDERRQGKSATDEGTVVTDHDGGRPSDHGRVIDPPIVDAFWRWPILDHGKETHLGW